MTAYLPEAQQLPLFSQINANEVLPALEQCLNDNRALLADLLKRDKNYNWNDFIRPLEVAENNLNRLWSPVSHLNAVCNTDALRDAYNEALPLISEYSTEMGQNADFFKAIQSIKDTASLNQEQAKSLDDALKSFTRSGINLDPEKQQRFKTISQKLSQLSSKFSDNVLDATNDWTLLIDDASKLEGLSENALAAAAQSAAQRELEGWLLTLEFPSFHAVMTYADDRSLREKVYRAYTTRASTEAENQAFNNEALMVEILQLRQEKAKLLGFDHYADYSVDIKMADSPAEVIGFLEELAEKSTPYAQQEFAQLEAFAAKELALGSLEAWDVAYASDKLKQALFNFSSEDLKPYFPVDRVLNGLFDIVQSLYGIEIKAKTDFDSWHDDVKFYEIVDDKGQLIAQFYLDLYARQHKRGGAWMADYCTRFNSGKNLQTPVAFMTCNASSPTADKPALFTHDEVITLFHEFGHGLHHMLTEVEYLSISGISGVEWDAVELPSQFMENFCWQRETLDQLAAHYETGEKLPDDLFNKIKSAQHFQSGMAMVRQLEFALFDLRIHMDKSIDSSAKIQWVLDQTREQVAVIPAPAFNRFQNSFSHIFAGGYAAGYYSYKWAEVLSADAFSRFEEEGLFSKAAGNDFLHEVLQKGGSRPAMESFIAFRGRKPSVEPLLRHNGLTGEAA